MQMQADAPGVRIHFFHRFVNFIIIALLVINSIDLVLTSPIFKTGKMINYLLFKMVMTFFEYFHFNGRD